MSCAPKSAGRGNADFCPVEACWPTSFAYAGSTTWVPAFGSVARCQAPRNTPSSSTESTAASRRDEDAMRSAAADREARDVRLGLRWVENLLHDAEGLGGL